MLKKLLIFDVDGTIWDSEKDVFLAFNHTLKTLDNFEISREKFQELAGMPLEKMFSVVLPENKKDRGKEYAKAYRKYYIDEEHFMDETILFADVKRVMDKFKTQGFLMTVASSKPKRVLDKMVDKFELDGFCYVLGTGESDWKHKPDPEVVNYIIEQCGVSKEDVVMIGDTTTDIFTGKNAGIDTIALTYGYDKKENLINANPTYIIDEFKTLEEIIEYKKS